MSQSTHLTYILRLSKKSYINYNIKIHKIEPSLISWKRKKKLLWIWIYFFSSGCKNCKKQDVSCLTFHSWFMCTGGFVYTLYLCLILDQDLLLNHLKHHKSRSLEIFIFCEHRGNWLFHQLMWKQPALQIVQWWSNIRLKE